MNQFIRSVSFALAGAALLTACSRPVATFQRSQPERFYSQQKATEPTVVAEEAGTPVAETSVAAIAPVAPVAPEVTAQTQQASEALASLKASNASNRRLTKRIERAETMLAGVNQQATGQTGTMVKKASVFQRLMLKGMDKKIQKHLAPKETNATSNYVRIGGIIALIGLLLLLLGNGVGATLGLIALIAGLVLILVGVINQGSL